jgi:hypothetical protein
VVAYCDFVPNPVQPVVAWNYLFRGLSLFCLVDGFVEAGFKLGQHPFLGTVIIRGRVTEFRSAIGLVPLTIIPAVVAPQEVPVQNQPAVQRRVWYAKSTICREVASNLPEVRWHSTSLSDR